MTGFIKYSEKSLITILKNIDKYSLDWGVISTNNLDGYFDDLYCRNITNSFLKNIKKTKTNIFGNLYTYKKINKTDQIYEITKYGDLKLTIPKTMELKEENGFIANMDRIFEVGIFSSSKYKLKKIDYVNTSNNLQNLEITENDWNFITNFPIESFSNQKGSRISKVRKQELQKCHTKLENLY